MLGGHSMGKDSIARTLSLLNKFGTVHTHGRSGDRCQLRRTRRAHDDQPAGAAARPGRLPRPRPRHVAGLRLPCPVPCQSSPYRYRASRRYRETEAMPELEAFSARIAEMLADLPRSTASGA